MLTKEVAESLKRLGFKKRRGNIYTVDLAPDVLGWLGLNQATKGHHKGDVEVNPVVGVRFQKVERVVAELRNEHFHPYMPPTICRPIGYVMPIAKYTCWVFSPSQATETAKEMGSVILEYGIPFMRSVTTLPKLCEKLAQRFGFDHLIQYREPVAWMLLGETTHAKKIVERYFAALGNRTDAASVEFRNFASALLARLASRQSTSE